ncbi:MipA/OmpV family protein [Pseudoalteromonas sp. GB56]
MKRCLFVLLMFLALSPWNTHASEEDYVYVDSNSWVIGAAFGYGKLASPLKNREGIPLYVLPDIRYYGERLSIDNLNVSYALLEKKGWVVELVGSQNIDGIYFPGKHRREYGALTGSFPGMVLDLFDTPTVPTRPSHRSMSYLAGIEARYYNSRWANIYVSWQSDVSNVHHGNEAKIRVLKYLELQSLKFSFEARLTHKSERLSDYYYGVKYSDVVESDLDFTARANTDFLLGVNIAYPVTENLAAITSFHQQWLGSGVNNSPLLRTTAPYSFFVGLKYVL